jgi:primosomal replication protein N
MSSGLVELGFLQKSLHQMFHLDFEWRNLCQVRFPALMSSEQYQGLTRLVGSSIIVSGDITFRRDFNSIQETSGKTSASSLGESSGLRIVILVMGYLKT